MKLQFQKYQGAGNDFIMIDDREGKFSLDKPAIEKLCDRRFGIGGDGLILIQNDPVYDFRMVYFNADGGEGSMCGNGGRCAVQFAHDLGIISESTRFIAVDGPHEASVLSDVVKLGMSDVSSIEVNDGYYFLNTGSPHYVEFVSSVAEADVVGRGRSIRYSEKFNPGGTNVNFTEVVGENHLKVRTYERGVEDETLACGTGVTACVLVAALQYGWKGPVMVDVPGGRLAVEFSQGGVPDSFTDILLIGPAKFVFEGVV